jgi:hypothetical protein
MQRLEDRQLMAASISLDAGQLNIVGTSQRDVIQVEIGMPAGVGGNDHLDGGTGHDYLYGGAGNDHLYGRSGNDYLYGGSGVDRLRGHDGNDIIKAKPGTITSMAGQAMIGYTASKVAMPSSATMATVTMTRLTCTCCDRGYSIEQVS